MTGSSESKITDREMEFLAGAVSRRPFLPFMAPGMLGR